MQGEKRKRWIEGAAGNQTIRHCPRRGSPVCAPRAPLGKGSLHSLEGGSKARPAGWGQPRTPAPPRPGPSHAPRTAGHSWTRGSPATLSSLMTHRDGAPITYSPLNLAGRQSAPCNSSAVLNVQRAPGQRLLRKRLPLDGGFRAPASPKPWLLTSTRK